MPNLQDEVRVYEDFNRLPKPDYFRDQRFTTGYETPADFWEGVENIPALPILNGLNAIWESLKAVWATMRAVGNLLILHIGDANAAIKDAGVHATLAIALAAMAPIHALTSSVELLTRTISSWFVSDEDFMGSSIKQLFTTEINDMKSLGGQAILPNQSYFNKDRFFKPYKSSGEFLWATAAPITTGLQTGAFSLLYTLVAVHSAIKCITNLVIYKPNHALEDLRKLGVYTTLAVSLALMTPINALVEGIAWITRLGTTWKEAIFHLQQEGNESEFSRRGSRVLDDDDTVTLNYGNDIEFGGSTPPDINFPAVSPF